MRRTCSCWCSSWSMSAVCPPSLALQICRSHWPFPSGSAPGPHTGPAGSDRAAKPASVGLFLQMLTCPCRCWWSVTGPRNEAGVLSRSKFSKPETDLRRPWCARRGWLWGLSPGGWSSGPSVDLQSECAGPPPRGPARSLWRHVL